MWVVVERKEKLVTAIIGPFETPQQAALWVADNFMLKLPATATIEKLKSPGEAAKPDGR